MAFLLLLRDYRTKTSRFVRKALQEEDEDFCLRAAYALGQIGHAAVPARIEAALQEDVQQVGSQADFKSWTQVGGGAYALGRMGPAAVPTLIERLHGEDKRVRIQAAYALGHMGHDAMDARPHLIKALQDEDDEVRNLAAIALRQIGS